MEYYHKKNGDFGHMAPEMRFWQKSDLTKKPKLSDFLEV